MTEKDRRNGGSDLAFLFNSASPGWDFQAIAQDYRLFKITEAMTPPAIAAKTYCPST